MADVDRAHFSTLRCSANRGNDANEPRTLYMFHPIFSLYNVNASEPLTAICRSSRLSLIHLEGLAMAETVGPNARSCDGAASSATKYSMKYANTSSHACYTSPSYVTEYIVRKKAIKDSSKNWRCEIEMCNARGGTAETVRSEARVSSVEPFLNGSTFLNGFIEYYACRTCIAYSKRINRK